MNFMAYGKASRDPGGARNAFIPEKYWAPNAPAKPNNRHDLFFKPQQEDYDGNTPNVRNVESNDDTVLTIKATSFFNRDESTLYMAITEGRGNASCEVGIAAIDVEQPELIMSQISDNFWYTGLLTKIAILSPTEILLPQALVNSTSTSKLYLYIKHTYPDVPIRAVPRRQFNDKKALEIIDHIHNKKYQSIRDMVANKYYALTASSALLQYLECVMNYSFAPNSLKIRYESKYGCMMIDLDTSHHLELLYPTCKTKERRACLYGVLNSCVTNVGKRNLRAQILQPSCELKQIIKTQECIKEFCGNKDLFVALEAILTKFNSVDKLLKFSVLQTMSDAPNSSKTMIGQILELKSCLENIPELDRLLATIGNSYFDDMKTVLKNSAYRQMLDDIITVIHPNAQITGGKTQFFQLLHAVNSNISSYLDLNRDNYTKLVDNINEIIGHLSATHNLPFRMNFMASKGFHIQLSVPKNGAFPRLTNSFEVLSKTKNTVNLTTNELRMLNARMFDVVEQIHIESNRIIIELVNGIRHNMAHLYDLCGLISSLDITLSLTKYSINLNDGCCPSFSSEMNVIDGIHPLLEYSRCKTTPIPNGVIANSEYHFFVITGPNMGGKTIYLKMIALLQILAQLGCFVPAKKAQFRVTDKILSRIGFGDRIDCNLSGFVLEMRETEYIFKNITPNSLVIIDELCRSTNPEEGEVLAWDICERFIRLIGVSNDGKYFDESDVPSSSKASSKSLRLSSITSPFIFFVTHFNSLTKLQDKFLSVVNLHFSATEEIVDGKVHLAYTYRIEDGVNQIKNYGISLAQYMNFPADVISRAVTISNELRQKQLPDRVNNPLVSTSSSYKRTTQHSTLLETTTSENSHLLRLFYNLYADMVSINRLEVTIEEKQEILTKRMKELADDLPSHVLEMAKNRKLLDLFKRSQNASNVWTPPERNIVESDREPVDESRATSTDFSLLSEHSIARRMAMEMPEERFAVTPALKTKTKTTVQQQSRVQFSLDNIEQTQTAHRMDHSFNEKRFHSDRATVKSKCVDNIYNFMYTSDNVVDQELTECFSVMTSKHESFTSGFVVPGSSDKTVRFSSTSSEKPRSSYQNTSTLAHPATSSKDYTKWSNTNTSQKGSSSVFSSASSSSDLFRLRLKGPLKVKDNRILKTPPKSDRNKHAPVDEFSKESTGKRSTSRLSLFSDKDFTPVEIPTIPSFGSDKFPVEFSADDVPTLRYADVSQRFGDSQSQSFQPSQLSQQKQSFQSTQFSQLSQQSQQSQPFELNFTQFFAKEDSILSLEIEKDLSDDITPIQSKTVRSTTNEICEESFAFSCPSQSATGVRKSTSNQNFYRYSERGNENFLSQMTDMSMSQLPSGNFFNLKSTIDDSMHQTRNPTSKKSNQPLNQTFIRKITVAPKITPPNALQFLQYTYNSQSDDDSNSDDDETTKSSNTKKEAEKFADAVRDKLIQQKNISPSGKGADGETERNTSSTFNVANVNDIILPAPPEFL